MGYLIAILFIFRSKTRQASTKNREIAVEKAVGVGKLRGRWRPGDVTNTGPSWLSLSEEGVRRGCDKLAVQIRTFLLPAKVHRAKTHLKGHTGMISNVI